MTTVGSRCRSAPLLGFFDGQQVVAGRAIVGNGGLSIAGGVVAIVATEAARVAHVADVVGMRPPSHLHLREHVMGENRHQPVAGRLISADFET